MKQLNLLFINVFFVLLRGCATLLDRRATLLDRRAIFLISCATLLIGCAGLSPIERDSEVKFSLRAKLGIRTENEGFSANIRWVQYQNRYEITLWGPLGQGRTEIVGLDGQIRISDAKGHLIEGGNAEEMMKDRLGWSMPLDVLQFWVQGRPAADHPTDASVHDDQGRLIRLSQLNWNIKFDWRDGIFTPNFPHKLVAERETSKITLVIKESQRISS